MEARQALSEVFKLQYDAPEALRLRSDVETREKDAAKARSEKEKLYSTALRASERGELSSAISSLEKLLDLNRAVPGAVIPERDKVYQAFYGNMISERSAVDNAYEEASRHLTEKNFEKALQVCDRILSKYPANAQFKALRIKIQDAQGLFLSAYIAEVGKSVESEASLDRRVGLLEEATKKFPNEQQFIRQLKLAVNTAILWSRFWPRPSRMKSKNSLGKRFNNGKFWRVPTLCMLEPNRKSTNWRYGGNVNIAKRRSRAGYSALIRHLTIMRTPRR